MRRQDNYGNYIIDPIEGEIRKVLISAKMMEEWAGRTLDGYRLRIDWRVHYDDPDYGEYWEPMITVDYDDKYYSRDEILVKFMKALDIK